MPCVRLAAAGMILAAGLLPADAQPPQTVPQAEPCVDGRTPGGEPCTLSDQLGETGGIIRPPPGVDPEIHVPPPDTGATPVLPPQAVPQQPGDGDTTPK